MTACDLQINGMPVLADIPPRLHLADFLREHLLLTGTHIGCEHGVCGACTILIDNEPARACITYAATCTGLEICTIEGLEHDPAMIRLRDAFSAEHALQCGYCTPGMLVTARDIVHRLPDATDDQIRLELAGNLCRCTGYNGIVRAIRRVLDERLTLASPTRPAIASKSFGQIAPASADIRPAAVSTASQDGLHPRLHFSLPADQVWAALQQPALLASCIPGATLSSIEGDRIAGEMVVAFGPARASFKGQAVLAYDAANLCGTITGGGADQASGTRLTAAAAFRVTPDGPGSILAVDIDFTLRGALSQLAKGRVVDLFAGEIAAIFARNLTARLKGDTTQPAAPLSGLRMAARLAWLWLTQRLRRHG